MQRRKRPQFKLSAVALSICCRCSTRTTPALLLLQVPGEMFALAMEARRRGAGTVGSTSNILDFIAAKVVAFAAWPAVVCLIY